MRAGTVPMISKTYSLFPITYYLLDTHDRGEIEPFQHSIIPPFEHWI